MGVLVTQDMAELLSLPSGVGKEEVRQYIKRNHTILGVIIHSAVNAGETPASYARRIGHYSVMVTSSSPKG